MLLSRAAHALAILLLLGVATHADASATQAPQDGKTAEAIVAASKKANPSYDMPAMPSLDNSYNYIKLRHETHITFVGDPENPDQYAMECYAGQALIFKKVSGKNFVYDVSCKQVKSINMLTLSTPEPVVKIDTKPALIK